MVAAGPYWDSSGYNELASADYLYGGVAHFSPAVGNAILHRLLGEDCARCGELAKRIIQAGVRVDTGSLDRHLAEQEASRVGRTKAETRYSRAVGDLIRRNAIPAASRNSGMRSWSDAAQQLRGLMDGMPAGSPFMSRSPDLGQ